MSLNKSTRRDLLRAGLCGMAADAESNGKIVVVLELSGGNDGLNREVPLGRPDEAHRLGTES